MDKHIDIKKDLLSPLTSSSSSRTLQETRNNDEISDDLRNNHVLILHSTKASYKFGPIDTSKAEAFYPYRKSIFHQLLESDSKCNGAPKSILYVCVIVTILLIAIVPFAPTIFAYYIPKVKILDTYNTKWDLEHRTTWSDIDNKYHFINLSLKLIRHTIGLEPTLTINIFYFGTFLPYLALALIDFSNCMKYLLSRRGLHKEQKRSFVLIQWPKSWYNASHSLTCYNDMFTEPMLYPNLVKRPGNTYSNFIYLFTAEFILVSCILAQTNNYFQISDFLFGVMLLILSVASTIWHSANAPFLVHYVDLWSMECCIIYYSLRYISYGIAAVFLFATNNQHNFQENLRIIASRICLLLFFIVILYLGRYVHYQNYKRKYFHGGFPLSGRNRLFHTVSNPTSTPSSLKVTTITACLYASLPVYAIIIPLLVLIYVLHTSGSIVATTISLISLSIGWSVRMLERFVLDGHVLMNWFISYRDSTIEKITYSPNNCHGSTMEDVMNHMRVILCTIIIGILSPTANLHFFTGITLMFGFIFLRSLD